MKQKLKKWLYVFTLWGIKGALLLCMSVSCKKDPVTPVCGCNSPTLWEIKDVSTRFSGDSYFFVNSDPKSGSYLGTACDTTLLKGLEISPPYTQTYLISGKAKAACIPEGIHPIVELISIELTSIRKKS